MSDSPLSDEKILASWRINAQAWGEAIRSQQIESRTLVTNRAIVEAVLGIDATRVLDLGCGEGWLARELAAHGRQVLGVDAVPALIEQARTGGGAEYEVMSYEAIAAGQLRERFDLVVANFSLLGAESVTWLFGAIPQLLNPRGAFVVQTLHPLQACGDQPYVDGWRTGSWAGFGAAFRDPAPWYFRTLGSWLALFVAHRLELVALHEPLHPRSAKPASLILVGQISSG